MKKVLPLVLALSATFSVPSVSQAQSTALTYQGRLNNAAGPANGSYDLRFAIFDAVAGGLQQGRTTTNRATVVSDGLFTVTLDPGAGVFTGANRWLEIAVRTNGGGAFDVLTPRQPLTATPYALYALTPAGPQGLPGLNGTNGVNGTNGLNGATGSQGPQGPIGLTGAQGPQGPIGLTGLQGLQGVQGLPGLNGTNGVNGVNGTNGLNGATGPQGLQGPMGLTGQQGPIGSTGPQGPQGPAGLNGTNGVNGLPGPQGPAGPLLANVALIDTNQVFSGTNRFAGVVLATNGNNQFNGSFTGPGGGLTSLSAANLAGTIPGPARCPASAAAG